MGKLIEVEGFVSEDAAAVARYIDNDQEAMRLRDALYRTMHGLERRLVPLFLPDGRPMQRVNQLLTPLIVKGVALARRFAERTYAQDAAWWDSAPAAERIDSWGDPMPRPTLAEYLVTLDHAEEYADLVEHYVTGYREWLSFNVD
jgi:hypothetical protein